MFGAWALLLLAIVVEVAATAALPRTQSFRDPAWTLVVLAGYAVAIWLLSLVIRHIPISVTYAVWAGLGTAGIATVGVLLLGERLDVVKAVALGMIILGVVVLNLHGAH
jgi:small multidrug resistance pump